jgi:hypothetical protein
LRYLRYQVISPEHASHKRYHHVKYDSAFVPLRNDVDSGSESVQKKSAPILPLTVRTRQ